MYDMGGGGGEKRIKRKKNGKKERPPHSPMLDVVYPRVCKATGISNGYTGATVP